MGHEREDPPPGALRPGSPEARAAVPTKHRPRPHRNRDAPRWWGPCTAQTPTLCAASCHVSKQCRHHQHRANCLQRDQDAEGSEKHRTRRNSAWGPSWPRSISQNPDKGNQGQSTKYWAAEPVPRPPHSSGETIPPRQITPSHFPQTSVSRSSKSDSQGPGGSGKFWSSRWAGDCPRCLTQRQVAWH